MKVSETLIQLPGALNEPLNLAKTKLNGHDHAELVLCLSFLEAENNQIVESMATLGMEFGDVAFVDLAIAFVSAHERAYKRAKELCASVDIDLDKSLDRPERFTGSDRSIKEMQEIRATIVDGTFKSIRDREGVSFESKHVRDVPAKGMPVGVAITEDGVRLVTAEDLPELMAQAAKAVANARTKSEAHEASNAFSLRHGTKH